ncbi:MAG: hypothetical protein MZV70_03965 [Desulfobacterales bacterium]|nr:hypothetical protein [Desulfobacterales bacterium]
MAGMALVVFVFAAVLMMAAGLQKTLVETGSPNNVVVVRKGSASEVMSSIERKAASVVEMLPQVATGISGQPMMAKEVGCADRAEKTGRRKGIQPFQRRRARHPIRIDAASAAGEACGRPYAAPGFVWKYLSATALPKRFQGVGLQQTLNWGMRTWTVVGIFDAGNTGFSSEIWGDVDQVMQAFRRPDLFLADF